MRKIDFMLILACLFVLRIIVFSAGYADAICLIAVLSFKLTREYFSLKKIESEVLVKVESQDIKLQKLLGEIGDVKASSDGLKAAMNLVTRR